MRKELELYLHIPFCVRKCVYCDFLSAPADEETMRRYVDALICEIESQSIFAQQYIVTTIFMGGGTPSILAAEETARIFRALHQIFTFAEKPEITIEVNPGTVSAEKLRQWKASGINRLSIGLQSTDDRELEFLGRIHTFEEFADTFHMARSCGFENINVDLISAIPGQDIESWERTLKKTAEAKPEHISAYSLILEEGTPFYTWYINGERPQEKQDMPALPGEDADREMYKRTEHILKVYGYERYEISNYAKKGYACRHNLGYWERKEYLGLGLGAASLIGERRFSNTSSLDEYLQIFETGQPSASARVGTEILSIEDQMEEFMFLGLRKMKGISYAEFFDRFGREAYSVYGEQIQKLKEEGLLKEQEGFLTLTDFGIDISNYVFEKFLFDR
ncbi:radical SAM family heme chaperone HemW [Mediterraneibacter massiliensis]|uniref:radical SAM family heme chaperone HemW n=1 Tax=Mediterraneibacter massiliensis TaxID=1720300 RepID=UPI000E53449D|nr:radical SAM family heme chaperone HemW [Mediterraneibacter massiliensis]RGT73609.1 oxygen-independent coproporphyrinogen III oxidase [Ruminococcus sp. AF18-22]